METKRIRISADVPNEPALAEAARLLQAGEVVAFPTETVYGLGANALNAMACARIFKVKGRPQDNPLIVHVDGKEMADRVVEHWSEQALVCAANFWPGPLTLVLPKTAFVPDVVTGGLGTVAVRMPSHPVALALIEQTGLPLAAPSANLSGRPSPTNGSHVWQDLRGKIPLILDAGPCTVGVESTVLDLSGELPTILRPGGVTKEELEKVLGEVQVDELSATGIPRAPGMKYRHYAPGGEMILLVGERAKILQRMHEEILKAHSRMKKVGILCTLESAPGLHADMPDLIFVLGSEQRPNEVANSLFEGLRRCDQQGMDLILAEGIRDVGLGSAIMNRLQKASGHRVIDVGY